jgi:hypothetical protein
LHFAHVLVLQVVLAPDDTTRDERVKAAVDPFSARHCTPSPTQHTSLYTYVLADSRAPVESWRSLGFGATLLRSPLYIVIPKQQQYLVDSTVPKMAGALTWPSSSSQPVTASKGRNHAFTVLTAPIRRTAFRTCLATSSLSQRSGAFYSGRRAKSADGTTRLAAHEESEVERSGGTAVRLRGYLDHSRYPAWTERC